MRFVPFFLCLLHRIALSTLEEIKQPYQISKYQSYDAMKQFLCTLSEKYPKIVTVEYPMYSSERRGIPLVKISKSPAMENIIIFIEAGMHGREWLSPAVAMYIINELVENEENANMIADIDWYISPLTNPDGYEYSRLHDESWRKTKSNYRKCLGVDANRNFDFHWEPKGDCGDDFPGRMPFSEPESLFIKNQILKSQDRVKLYLSLHCCGAKIFHPWGYTDVLPEDIDQILDIAYKVQKEMSSIRDSVYAIGSPSELEYVVPGSSYDWVKGVGKVNLSFTIELAGEPGTYIVPEREILPTAYEMFEGIKMFHKELVHKYVDN